ncbi:UNVERIFIED_CONTAM: protein NRT1/ PTR FAMILY 1.2 [Sesamum angustifolium]|uniref:Protein NRT1/ PTR FAMILY 1.2 n=1 Tax=Sesamum angustifolium TaxID=2727405 RepID=A0AAW2K6H9_9LAMI
MESCCEEKKTLMAEKPLLEKTRKRVNDALEKMATFGVMANMILYLVNEYHMEMATASNILFLWTAANNFMPVLGAAIADSYLGSWIRGIRASSMAFGADQLENADGKENSSVGDSYFSWYYTLYMSAILMGNTCVVYVQDNMGWKEPRIQITIRCHTNIIYYHKNGPAPGFPSSKLRFLNKACIVRDPQKDLMPDRRARDPWSLCTVDQVEELKALLRVVPIWSSGMIMFVDLSQNSFSSTPSICNK